MWIMHVYYDKHYRYEIWQSKLVFEFRAALFWDHMIDLCLVCVVVMEIRVAWLWKNMDVQLCSFVVQCTRVEQFRLDMHVKNQVILRHPAASRPWLFGTCDELLKGSWHFYFQHWSALSHFVEPELHMTELRLKQTKF